MVAHIRKVHLAADEIVAAPSPELAVDRNFELPPQLLLGVFGLFMGALAVMSLGFMNPALMLPMAVNFIFVAAFAFLPAKWATMKPAKTDRAMRLGEFRDKGIDTLTGHSSAGEATLLVLLLPALIFLWSVAVVAIAALTF